MFVKLHVTMTLDVQSTSIAEMLVQEWVDKLIYSENVVEGEVVVSEKIPIQEEFDIPYPEEDDDYPFEGFPNYGDHPL